jgi:CRP-like cAMP-binding protein
MSSNDGSRSPIDSNRLLRAFDEGDRARLLEHGQIVRLGQKQTLFEPDQPYTDVYFPGDCVLSLLTVFRDGAAVETATIGCEGMLGIPVYLGTGAMPVLAMNQLAGEALRVRAEDFARLAEAPRTRLILDRYTQAFLSQVFQNAACNAHHPIVERCARWLLMTHDRVRSRHLALTHELLAYMLGVRRAGVTEAAGELQAAGYIRYSRGRVEVLDRQGLESAACECYAIIHRAYEELLGSEAISTGGVVR